MHAHASLDTDTTTAINDNSRALVNRKPKILIIGSNSLIQELIKDILRNETARFMTAQGSATGYILARTEKPDIIIIDRDHNDLCQNTNDVAKECDALIEVMKLDHRTKTIPITVIGSQCSRQEIDHSITLGAEDFIVKPFSMLTLKTKITRLANVGSIFDDRFYHVSV